MLALITKHYTMSELFVEVAIPVPMRQLFTYQVPSQFQTTAIHVGERIVVPFGNRKVVWKFTQMFNVDKYVEENWFVSTLEMDNIYFDEMTKAKDLYVSRRINFLEYFFKRLDVYNSIEASKHHKYYKNVDINKYKDKIKNIFKDLPSMTKEGDFDI